MRTTFAVRVLALIALVTGIVQAGVLTPLRSIAKLFNRSSALAPSSSSVEVQKTYSDNVMNTYGRYPLTISHGKGSKLWGADGKQFLDCASGIATCCLGHAHPEMVKAVSDQMGRVHHCSNLYFIPEQAALARWLVDTSCADKAFFCNSGAEANEAAIKLARKYAHTKLNIDFPVIITAINSFHGRTLTAITATGQPKYQKDFGPLTPGFEYAEYNDVASLRAVVEGIKNSGGGRGLAAILMEPLQGEGGIKPATLEFFAEVRKICTETGALMMVDEVQTGVGRTGKMWGYQNFEGIEPDVITSAKALGGGVPIGSMMCKEKFNVFGPGDHASTYGGNALACAAGLAVARVFQRDNVIENVQQRGDQMRSLARELATKYPAIVKDVRGWGLINGIELKEDCGFGAAEVTKALLESGVLVVPAGPKVIRFVPPLIITEKEVAQAMSQVEDAFKALLSQPKK